MITARLLKPLAVAATALCVGVVAAADPAATPTAPPKPEAKASIPLEQQPYRIRAVVSVDPSARIDARRRERLLSDWKMFIQRFVGSPWRVEIDSGSPAESLTVDLEGLTAESAAAAVGDAELDKVWLIRIAGDGAALSLQGREFDVTTGRLGSIQRRSAPFAADLVRTFFLFSLDLFSPYAEIGERFGKDVSLTIRGAALPAASPIGQVVTAGAIFVPLRVIPQKQGRPIVRDVNYTFLRVEQPKSTGARCSVVSVYSDPFTKRVVQKTSLAALGVKPGKSPTRLRFLTLPDRAPAAGYVLTAKRFPDGSPREVGTTDREGRITLDPTWADGLLVLRLLAGGTEPMVEFPLMPGDVAEERAIAPFDPKPQAVALEAQLESLRDEIIDLVAVRARLEARIKARFDGEDWPGAEESLKEYQNLPPRDALAQRITSLKDESMRQQAKAKKAILTKTAQALLTDLQGLVDRYLDDDVFKGFADALAQIKGGAVLKKPAQAAKGKTAIGPAAKAAPAAPAEPEPEPAPAPQPAKPTPPPPVVAPPRSTVPF